MPDTAGDPFVHEALLYTGAADYLAATVPFVVDGLAAGEPVLVAVPGPNLDLLRDALGCDAARIRLVDMAQAGRNPGRIIGSVLTAFADEHPGRRVRVIGEPIWAGRSATEYVACVQHEALINVAFAGRAGTILCPYDTRRLQPTAVIDSTRTHPVLVHGTHRVASPEYRDPLQVVATVDRPLPYPGPECDVDVMVVATGARDARRFVHERAVREGMAAERISELRRAVHEAVTNTLVHAGGRGLLSVWIADGHLVCEVQDGGRVTDPLAGRRAPEPFDGRGRGLFLVNLLCDLVRVHWSGAGSTIRMYKLLA
ncbi:MAG TPA: sensor histidine kinase [Pseudonocardia sp.]|nr:sensor histidine kinase [Pseudonocardia sp.]